MTWEVTYSVKGRPIDSAADKYTLSVNAVVLSTLTSSLSFTTTKETKYFQFTPSAAGWYKFTSSYGDIGIYDDNLSVVLSKYTTDNGSLAELEKGSTYYLTYNR